MYQDRITGNNLSMLQGVRLEFPQILVNYTIVDLSDNIFEGEIPSVIGSLTSLIVLNLSHNSLTSQIPYALGDLSEIESLDLSWKQLTGEIPRSLADLTFLGFLNVSHKTILLDVFHQEHSSVYLRLHSEGIRNSVGLRYPKCVAIHRNHNLKLMKMEIQRADLHGKSWCWGMVVVPYLD